MAFSNYDIGYMVGAIEPVFSGIETAIIQLDGIMMNIHDGDISLPTFDEAFIRSIKADLVNTHDILMSYETELKARKH